jgi:hypothetical protein
MGDRERVADHEAGHLLLAAATRYPNGAAIEAVGNRYRGVAQDLDAIPAHGEPDRPTFEGFDKLQRDFVMATAFAKLTLGMRGWLPYLRTLWLRTDAILAEHWICLKMLSSELQRTGCVRRDRAQQIIDRWYGVLGNSLVEVLTRTPPQHHQE